jgi:hypothetical protein
VLEGPHVLAQQRLEVLAFGEVQVLAAGITQDIAEQVDPPRSLGRELDRVHGPIHLGLSAGSRLEALDQPRGRSDAQGFDPLAQHRIIRPGSPRPAVLPASG